MPWLVYWLAALGFTSMHIRSDHRVIGPVDKVYRGFPREGEEVS